ncbi:hypothetical protein V7107_06085 [Bacillus toyonensis]|nr:hypothetical protein [Bacillus toyonensis]PEO51225.1 hypothetical protein CN579_28405 [Bacillus toyonensis]
MPNDMEAQIGADISEFNRAMDRVDRRLDSFGRFQNGIIGGAMLVGPSVVPAVASLAAGVGALGASFAAAGAGVAAFGAVAVPTLTKVFEANKNISDLEEKVASATTAKEKAAAIKELEAAYAGLSEKQKETIGSMKDFGSFWDEFTGKFEEPILDTFIGSMGTAKTVLTAFEPAIQSTITGINKLFESFNQTLQADDMKAFFTWIGNNAGSSLVALSTTAGNVFRGLANIFMAFTPLMKEMESGMVSMTEKFVQWSQSFGKSNGFQMFLDYVRANGPVMLSVIGQLTMLLVNLGVAFAPVGAAILKAIDGFLKFTNSLLQAHPALGTFISVLAVLGGAFLLLSGPIGAVLRIGTSLIRFFSVGGVGAATFGRVMAALAPVLMFLGGPIGLIGRLLIGLIPIFAKFLMGNEAVKTGLTNAWNAIVAALQPVIQAISNAFSQIMPIITNLISQIVPAFANFVASLAPVLATLGQVFSAVFTALTPVIAEFAQAFATLAPQFQQTGQIIAESFVALLPSFQQLGLAFVQLIQTLTPIVTALLPMLATVFTSVFSLIMQAVVSVMPIIVQLIQSIISVITMIVSTVLPMLLSIVQAVFPVIMSIIQAAIPVVIAILQGLAAIITGVIVPTIQLILSIVQAVFPAVMAIIQSVIGIITNIIKLFTSVLKGDWSSAWEAVKGITSSVMSLIGNIIQGAISLIGSIVQSGLNLVQSVFSSVLSAISSLVSSIFSGISSVISSVMSAISTR